MTQPYLQRITVAIPALVLVAALCGVAAACPTCKDSLAESGNDAGLIRGYFWSILFMMSMPFLILTGLSGYMYLEVRRARAKRTTEVPAPAASGQVMDRPS